MEPAPFVQEYFCDRRGLYDQHRQPEPVYFVYGAHRPRGKLCGRGSEERRVVGRLAFYIRELLRNLSIPDFEHIDSPKVPGFAFLCLAIDPADNTTIAGGENILRLEIGIRIVGEEFLPIGPDRKGTLHPGAIWRRAGIFEQAVFRHGIHYFIHIMTIEGRIEAFDCGYGWMGSGFIHYKLSLLFSFLNSLGLTPFFRKKTLLKYVKLSKPER